MSFCPTYKSGHRWQLRDGNNCHCGAIRALHEPEEKPSEVPADGMPAEVWLGVGRIGTTTYVRGEWQRTAKDAGPGAVRYVKAGER